MIINNAARSSSTLSSDPALSIHPPPPPPPRPSPLPSLTPLLPRLCDIIVRPVTIRDDFHLKRIVPRLPIHWIYKATPLFFIDLTVPRSRGTVSTIPWAKNNFQTRRRARRPSFSHSMKRCFRPDSPDRSWNRSERVCYNFEYSMLIINITPQKRWRWFVLRCAQ